jgi:hypothetical protein
MQGQYNRRDWFIMKVLTATSDKVLSNAGGRFAELAKGTLVLNRYT